MEFLARCTACGTILTSKPGITLHLRRCKEGAKAIPAYIKPEECSDEQLRQFAELSEIVIDDGVKGLEGNIQAGRRARHALNEIRLIIPELRGHILDGMGSSRGPGSEPTQPTQGPASP
jgi:hypothetical protein